MSLESSLPTSVADAFVPFWNVTLNELAPSTTWAFVMMSPCES